MPLREYECECGEKTTELFMQEYPKTIRCKRCGSTAKYIFSPASFTVTFRDGWDAGAGAYFDSKRQRDEHLRTHELEPMPDGAYGKEGADIKR